MFKNRVRTAALAGAVAVATGVSGLTVPANAVELPTANTGLHFNDNDGSALLTGGTAYQPTATQTAEDQIVAVTNQVHNFLQTERGQRDSVRAEYLNLFASKDPNRVLDPSEQAAKEAFDKRAAQVSEQLKASDKNSRDIRASIRAALDLDEAAAKAYDDWNADYITAVNVTKDKNKVAAINALVDQLNDANKAWTSPVGAPDTGKIGYEPVQVTVTKPGDRFEYAWNNDNRQSAFEKVALNNPESFAALAAQLEVAYLHASGYDAKNILQGEYGWPVAGKFNASRSDSEEGQQNFIRRELIPALDAIRAQEDIATFRAAVEAKKSKEAALTAAIYAAQRSDVLVLQSLLRRSEAQTRLLRIIEADYRMLARYIDLYEDDTLVPVNGNEVALQTQYKNVVDAMPAEIKTRFDLLDWEEENWWSGYQTFSRDLENPKAEIEQYDADKKKFAQDVYSKILNDDWMSEVTRVELLDAKYHPKSPQNVGSLEAQQKKAKEESEMRNAFTKWLNSQNGDSSNNTDNGGKDTNNGGKDTNNGGKDTNNGGNDTKPGKDNISGATIAAIVIGVLAALGGIVAVAFPHIQQFLPKF